MWVSRFVLTMRSARSLVSRTAGVLCALAAGLLFVCGSASAALTHEYRASFGSFSSVQGVAVDSSTEDVYVFDGAANGGSLYKFDSEGAPAAFSALPGEPTVIEGVGKAGEGEGQIAVDDSATGPAKGDIYVAAGAAVKIFAPDGRALGELSEAAGKPWGKPCGVAVGASGHVYVGLAPTEADLASTVNQYVPKANPVLDSDYVSSLWNVNDVCNLAVDGIGNVYADTFPEGPVTKYEALQFSPVEVPASGSQVSESGRALTVDPTTDPVSKSANDVYVARYSEVAQYEPAGGLIGTFTGLGENAFGDAHGVAVNTTSGNAASGDVYVSDNEHARIDIFGPTVITPEVVTGAPSGQHGVDATLNGTVTPGGVPIRTCQFEYGATEAYGSSAPCEHPDAAELSDGTSTVAVTASLTGLAAGTYYYRLSVTDEEGVVVNGANETFTTALPAVEVAAPSGVQSASATLNGTVNPEGVPVETCQFEYGTTEAYGSSAPCEHPDAAELSDGTSTVAVAASPSGLEPSNTYYYRLAITPVGAPAFYSSRETFVTPPAVESSALASDITSFAATLTGVLLSGEVTPEYHFAYGLTSAYGSNWPTPDAEGNAEGQQTLSQTLTGLQPGTTYHYALVATNFAGGVTVGPDETFTTRPLVPPGVSTGGTGEIVSTSTALTGAVDPEGLPTTYRFEYGTSTAYGSSWPGIQVFAGSGSTAQPIAVTVPNLQPSTTYHYRLVASNEDGTSYGADATFTTSGYPVSVVKEAPVLTTNLGFVNPEAPATTEPKTTTQTKAEKLAKALKVCHDKKGKKRSSCEKAARKRFGVAKKKGK